MLEKRGKFWFGETQADIEPELARFSALTDYPIDHFARSVCHCGSNHFQLGTDEVEGIGLRTCVLCNDEHLIGDSADYVSENSKLDEHCCICDEDVFEITARVHLYREDDDVLTDDVRWFYLGCRCVSCGLIGCYADWKNEFEGYRTLLGNV